ncbi:mannan endo-1,4-beta-mannosidase-like isoform X2 [Styela clava]
MACGCFRWIVLFVLSVRCSTSLTMCKSKICADGKTIFLSGVNQAWENYGKDFGNKNFKKAKSRLTSVLSDIHKAGGNSIRIFLHTDASSTPQFTTTGFVTAADSNNNHIDSEMKEYLDEAKKHKIYVFFVLWNFAVFNSVHSKKISGLVTDEKKLRSYIDKALIPIVKGLKGHEALGGYDIANEPEGAILANQYHRNPCFNTKRLKNTGVGWWQKTQRRAPLFSMQQMLRFLNWQAHAIKTHDRTALVTVGAWSQKTVHELTPDSYNYYSDKCLIASGGLLKYRGKLDFYQMHTYTSKRSYDDKSPMEICAATHNLDKPIVIGEFSESGADGRKIEKLFKHAYYGEYAGCWSWHAKGTGKHSDSFTVQKRGLMSITGLSSNKYAKEHVIWAGFQK